MAVGTATPSPLPATGTSAPPAEKRAPGPAGRRRLLEPSGAEGEALAQLLIRPRDSRNPASPPVRAGSDPRRSHLANPVGPAAGASPTSAAAGTKTGSSGQTAPANAFPHAPATTAPAPAAEARQPETGAPDSWHESIHFSEKAPPAVLADQVRALADWREAELRGQATERAPKPALPARETGARATGQEGRPLRPETTATPEPAAAPPHSGDNSPPLDPDRREASETGARPTPESAAAPVSHSASPVTPADGPAATPAPLPTSPLTPSDSNPTGSAALAGRLVAARNSAAGTEARPGWGALLEQLQGRVEQLRVSEGGRARLSLEPAELGHLDVLLERDGSGWRLEIRAGNADTARQLQNQAQELHDRLLAAGVRLDELRLHSPGAGAGAEPPGPLPALAEDGAPTSADPDSSGKRRAPDEAEGEAAGERKSPSGLPGEEFASRLESLLRRGSAGGAT